MITLNDYQGAAAIHVKTIRSARIVGESGDVTAELYAQGILIPREEVSDAVVPDALRAPFFAACDAIDGPAWGF